MRAHLAACIVNFALSRSKRTAAGLPRADAVFIERAGKGADKDNKEKETESGAIAVLHSQTGAGAIAHCHALTKQAIRAVTAFDYLNDKQLWSWSGSSRDGFTAHRLFASGQQLHVIGTEVCNHGCRSNSALVDSQNGRAVVVTLETGKGDVKNTRTIPLSSKLSSADSLVVLPSGYAFLSASCCC